MTKPTGADNTGGPLTNKLFIRNNIMAAADLTAEHLREILEYNPETGIFTWRVRAAYCIKVGDVCGSKNSNGYLFAQIKKTSYSMHRLAWLYVTGTWPVNHIDHINGIRDDNRFSNLRDISVNENMQNRRRESVSSTSGFLGVTKANGKYQAQISVNGIGKYLGVFKTPELAFSAYVSAKRLLHSSCTI